MQNQLLNATLVDFLPTRESPPIPSKSPTRFPFELGRHLVYFPPVTSLSSLLSDGTDPDQSPGDPFVRRMWAGGSITQYNQRETPIKFHRRFVCLERITDVTVKGLPGDEKVFVTIERRVSGRDLGQSCLEDFLRKKLLQDGACMVIETRNIVFLRRKSRGAVVDEKSAQSKILRPSLEPEFSQKITPSAALLFRFSALTFNAHRIHLDKQYCCETEGHRNLLVHGPLSLLLMLEVLKSYLRATGQIFFIGSVEYRNIAPLYAEEEMKVCGRPKGDGKWDIWIEGKEGGYAVKGVAHVLQI